ncbi:MULTISPECIES: GNAT family N-acetyltransferase [unclassified Paenibacillus]|uniref:GNAT family N-acetyltransferase n=1 Tax=unclassified Paenibacillus TaxID=185978 RepID=UPI0024072613|nr:MULTISPECIES: GNAT family N-acetyltransferase [unclassified Paenibacillus]MDF9842063.1 GNAT superfamily N-acetyltransferase [Paenibacillus sp. PastF-2]MDF9848683.1 GNAT superfamily N-acetyltransferase [Paenibacillus sp. PastM-2]MDF9855252.1 GNAT superfamily N-acetyltransferase [Paenibacillus sp. PastF-1]MDH6480523.1 GNAT superfamily N-acetyltransferase [Paenibacillus sp. PastH-2]MDH6507950.1 GNAT superfamily N-acetyltransferase [Paenibacillus sp. PastM-3]
MIFETKLFIVEIVGNDDVPELVNVYNSNPAFLLRHLGVKQIAEEWLEKELMSMRELNFLSCKIVQKISGRIIGVIDFLPGTETYLSLLLLDQEYQAKGLGKEIYSSFEGYIRSLNIPNGSIRIDVVTGYKNSVLNFWERNGFTKAGDTELEWEKKTIKAAVMRKRVLEHQGI